jgi:hypothetical protein
MKLVETTIAGGNVRVRYATEDQSEWLDLRFAVEGDHSFISEHCIEPPFSMRKPY